MSNGKDLYVVRVYAGPVCISNRMVDAATMDDAIGMVVHDTVGLFDDGLTHVDACLGSEVYNGQFASPAVYTVYEVKYQTVYIITINGRTYDTRTAIV